MSLAVSILVLVAADAVAVAAMLAVRERAPAGSYFKDTQQAAGAFAVAGTTFAVLVAFTFLLAFQSYDNARDSAENEATATAALFHTAELFAPADRDRLQGELICYGRAVADSEWRAMRENHQSPRVQGWIRRLELTVDAAGIDGPKQQTGFEKWADQNIDRQGARRGRLSEAAPFVPPLVWVLLITGGVIVVVFVGFFADARERRLAQAMMIVSVTTMVVASLLMVKFLDDPYEAHAGGIRPSAMQTTVELMVGERASSHAGTPLPCDGHGRARSTV